jgi:hypothetical protein
MGFNSAFKGLSFHIHILDYKRNEEILEDLEVEPTAAKLGRYKLNWLQYATRMNNNKMPKIISNFRRNGRRRLGSS